MSDSDDDAALAALRADLLGELADDRNGITNIILETLNIVSFQQAEISKLRAALLYLIEVKYAEALQVLRVDDQKKTTARLIDVLSKLREFLSARRHEREH